MSNFLIAQIRTWVPALVGGAIVWLSSVLDLTFAQEETTAVIAFATSVTIGLYYLAVRLLAEKWPALGWLLGYQSAPRYYDPGDPRSAGTGPRVAGTPAPTNATRREHFDAEIHPPS